jgi:hypothetical protein
MPRIIVQEFTSKVFGQKRYPRITLADDRDAEDWCREAEKQAQLRSKAIELRDLGGSQGAVLVVVKVINGEYRVELIEAKLVKEDEVVWADRDNWIPRAVVIQYKFWSEERDPLTNRMTRIQRWFRREISDIADMTYQTVPVGKGDEPQRMADANLTFNHGFGFCPVVWMQNTPNSRELDGEPDYTRTTMEKTDRINEILSQSHRAIHENLDPAVVLLTKKKGGRFNRGGGKTTVLDPGDDAKVLGGPAEMFGVAKQQVDLYRAQGLEASQCVILDSEKVSGAAQSAEAMEFLHGKMLDRCDVYRDQYGAGLRRVYQIILWIGRKVGAGIRMGQREVKNPDDPQAPPQMVNRSPGKSENVSLVWGPYFVPTLEDVQKATASVTQLLDRKVIDLETGVRWIARYLGIEDSEAVIRRLQQQSQVETERREDVVGRMMDAANGNGTARTPRLRIGPGAPAAPGAAGG